MGTGDLSPHVSAPIPSVPLPFDNVPSCICPAWANPTADVFSENYRMSPGLLSSRSDSYAVFGDSNSQTTEKILPLDPRRSGEVGGRQFGAKYYSLISSGVQITGS